MKRLRLGGNLVLLSWVAFVCFVSCVLNMLCLVALCSRVVLSMVCVVVFSWLFGLDDADYRVFIVLVHVLKQQHTLVCVLRWCNVR